jgi:hypothetical protein
MLRRATILFLTTASTIYAAPVPRYRPAPPPVPAAGEYVLTWASIQTRVSLKNDGGYSAVWGGREWRGTWCWDAKTRTLHVQETTDGQVWSDWSVQLNGELTGAAQFGQSKTQVSLRVVKEDKRATEGVALAR